MSKGFKSGDLAMVKTCKTYPALVGRCVELIVKVPKGTIALFEGHSFIATDAPGDCWIICCEDLPMNSALFGVLHDVRQNVGLFLERNLMPLRGDDCAAPALETVSDWAERVGA